jgi:hypothetical protein
MNADKASLIAKIRALKAKTIASGATEAEAIAAAEKVAQLMRSYSLSDVDVEMSETSAVHPKTLPVWRLQLITTVAYVSNCAALQVTEATRAYSLFIGAAPGPEIASYLLDICQRSIEAGLKDFRRGSFYRARRSNKTRRAASEDYCTGMSSRLRNRLHTMFRETSNDEARSSARAAIAEKYPDTKSVSIGSRKSRFDDARYSGWRAGGDVQINRGLRDDKPLLIGGPS